MPSSPPVLWDKRHQNALEELLNHLVNPPILGYPDFCQPFLLYADASQQGLGAVLCQNHDGNVRVIGYGSRSLLKADRNYHLYSGKLEFLALKWADCEHFRDYLNHAPHFVVYTDNNPLTHVLSTAKFNVTGHRWVAELANFCFTIKYIPEQSIKDADALSRMPMDIASYMETCTEILAPDDIVAGCMGLDAQERGDAVWVSAVTDDVRFWNLDEEYIDSTLGAISRVELVNAREQDPVIEKVLRLEMSCQPQGS